MSRRARVVLPRYPHHIVQRGHNRQVIFAEPKDYARYLDTLREFKEEHGVAVYAFCLMTNHVHLLLAPREPAGIGKLMKRLAGRQTRHHNRLEGRSGTLWEGRYKSSLVQRDEYLMACCRYRLGQGTADWLDYDPCYLALGVSETARRRRYREFLQGAIPGGEWELIREAIQRGQLTGTERFTQEVADILGRRVE